MTATTTEQREARRARVAALSAELPVPVIARQLGVSERTVTRDRVEVGVAKSSPRKLSATDRARIETLLADGASLAEIARTMDRHTSLLSKHYTGRSVWRGNLLGNGRHAALKQRLGL